MVGGWEDGNTGERVVLYVCHSSQAHGSPYNLGFTKATFLVGCTFTFDMTGTARQA